MGNIGITMKFLLPQFASDLLSDGKTLHGFGQYFCGELHALSQASGVASGGTSGVMGGTIYRIATVPEASTVILLLGAAAGAFAVRRRLITRR